MLSEDQAFALLKRRIFLDRGLDCEQYKENYLKRRIAVRLRATNTGDYLSYLNLLRNSPDEYRKLLDELTINVTQFFRDKDVYGRLRSDLLPMLLESKRSVSSRSLRVWSAGCASGEEPYSVAMLVEEALRDDDAVWNIRILGSDIDEASLKVAREGVYSQMDILDGMDPSEYFEVQDTREGRRYLVKENIRRRVKLERINLLEGHGKAHFDLVLCRNVLIYFGRDVQSKIIESLASGFGREGYLVLGKSETLGPEAGKLFKPCFPRERIYQLVPPEKGAPTGGVTGSG